jgi:hypothetical protein
LPYSRISKINYYKKPRWGGEMSGQERAIERRRKQGKKKHVHFPYVTSMAFT